tara:strand:+ start:320 stop:439 length:120 start_codon:yes stop_codon:yes gene_type:complete
VPAGEFRLQDVYAARRGLAYGEVVETVNQAALVARAMPG